MPQQYPWTNLEVVGTARRPNRSDLKARGLSGLLDTSPDVAVRRAELASQQPEDPKVQESYLRTRIGECESTDGATAAGADQKRDSHGEERGRGVMVDDGQGVDATDVSSVLLGSLVANEAFQAGKTVRSLRDRKPVQLSPYAVEREGYRQAIQIGRAEK